MTNEELLQFFEVEEMKNLNLNNKKDLLIFGRAVQDDLATLRNSIHKKITYVLVCLILQQVILFAAIAYGVLSK